MLLYKLYKAAFELQPAVEMQLWKGASLGLQVCLPVINNEPGKWDCIRPGYLTLRQEFRLDNHWKGYLTGGISRMIVRGLLPVSVISHLTVVGQWKEKAV